MTQDRARATKRSIAMIGTALAGLADSHSASVSVAAVFAAGHFGMETAAMGVLACLSSNALTKIVVAATGEPPRNFTLVIAAQVIAATLGSWLVLVLVR